MVQLSDIHPLTDFLRNHREHIRRLKRAGKAEVLTVNGKAELIVQDAASYQKLLDAAARAHVLEGIRRGLESMQKGRGRSLDAFDAGMRKKFKLPRRK